MAHDLKLAMLLLAFSTVQAHAQSVKAAPRPSRLHIEAATFITGAGVPVLLRDLDAEIAPRELQPKPPTIHGGFAYLTTESLSKLIKSKIQSDGLTDLTVETMPGQRAKITGKMEKAGIPVPVSVEGPVSVTSQGMLLLKMESKKAGILPLGFLTKLFGVNMEKKVATRSVRMTKDQLVVDPRALLGTTAQGQVVGINTDHRGLTLRFGTRPGLQRSKRK